LTFGGNYKPTIGHDPPLGYGRIYDILSSQNPNKRQYEEVIIGNYLPGIWVQSQSKKPKKALDYN
jgi:hypothetical protein